MARLWPLARAEDAESAGNHPGATDSLTGASKTWQTPKAGGRNAYRGGDRSQEPLLYGQAQEVTQGLSTWATPAASETRQGYQRRPDGMASQQNQQSLSTQAMDSGLAACSTPRARDWKQGGKDCLTTDAEGFQPGLQDQMIGPGGKPFSLGGRILRPQLSALFVEWLMGVPLGWTCVCAPGPIDSEDSETLSSLPRPKRRSGSSGSARSACGSEAV